jgi:hypothetical protein
MGLKWFGPPWPSAICYGTDGAGQLLSKTRLSAPVGSACLICRTPILQGESGIVMTCRPPAGDPYEAPLHRECFVLDVSGPLSHVRRRCHHFGGTDDDGPHHGRTVREEALAVWEHLQNYRDPRWFV